MHRMTDLAARGLDAEGRARRALVTGSGGGLGRAIVERLRAEGYDVVTMDLADADIVCDLARDEVDADAIGDVDVCVANAGIVDTLSPSHRMSAEKWQRDIDVNLTGAFRVVQACLAPMRARGHGRIVVTSSLAALTGGRGQVAYAASKAGLIGMVKVVAAEHVERGITCNAICPGLIATPKSKAMPDEVKAAVADVLMPSGRMGEPSEVAGLVAYLVSDEAGYVTGQAIAIDGGASLNTLSLGTPQRRG
jgi:NAD(P)-dependent dehydrogenase (short-subunit alcohol dehydrogenase family)